VSPFPHTAAQKCDDWERALTRDSLYKNCESLYQYCRQQVSYECIPVQHATYECHVWSITFNQTII